MIRKNPSNYYRLILPIIFPGFVIVFWFIVSYYNYVNPYFYPPPYKIFSSFINLFSSHLIPGIIASLTRIMVATLLSSAISIPLGIIMASNEYLRGLFDPFVKLRYLPAFALMPLLILIVGIDETNKILFLVLSITLYFLPSVINSVDAVPNELLETARTLGATEKQIIINVIIPASMPDIFSTFIIINGISWNSLMVAEIINAREGLGHIMNMARQRGQMETVLVTLIIIYIFAVIMDMGIKYYIKKKYDWKYS